MVGNQIVTEVTCLTFCCFKVKRYNLNKQRENDLQTD